MIDAINRIKRDKMLTQPVILAFTQTGSMGATMHQLFVVIDFRPVELKTSEIFSALEMLFASYFTFNLRYPSSLTQVYSFLELLFSLPPSAKIATAVNHLYSRIFA
jgi:hypothetical protein